MDADPRHAELVVKHYGLGVGRVTTIAGTKAPKKEETPEDETDEDDILLGPQEAREHRGIAARLNYLTVDRADIQFATKELARTMSAPKRGDVAKAKRIARYLLGRPRAVMNFDWQEEAETLSVYSDSDWAGCVATRKSTSGGVAMIGGHLLKSYSRQQKTIALSSAEAELYALVAASAEAMGLVAYAKDLGINLHTAH